MLATLGLSIYVLTKSAEYNPTWWSWLLNILMILQVPCSGSKSVPGCRLAARAGRRSGPAGAGSCPHSVAVRTAGCKALAAGAGGRLGPQPSARPPLLQRLLYLICGGMLIYTLNEVGNNPTYRDEMMQCVFRESAAVPSRHRGRRRWERSTWHLAAGSPPLCPPPTRPCSNFPGYTNIYTANGGAKDDKSGYNVV